MKWEIRKMSDDRHIVVNNHGKELGEIAQLHIQAPWRVSMLVSEFDNGFRSLPEAFAYVKGLETATRVYGKEIFG